MGLDSYKSFFASKTIWGALLSLVPVVDTGLSMVGLLPPGTISEGAKILVGAAGSLLAIYGRVKAEKRIG